MIQLTAATLLALTMATQSAAATGPVPPRFHGRWADTVARCPERGAATSAVTIGPNGWSGYEEAAEVVAVLPPVNGATRFRTRWSGNGDETAEQIWSMRLLGGRLYWLILQRGQAPIRYSMIRCPAR